MLIPLIFILFASSTVISTPGPARAFTDDHLFGRWLGQAKRPFPQHVSYTPGTIKPNVDQEKMDHATEVFYEAWKARYLKDDCGSNQIYVWFDSASGGGDASPGSISVSEGQGYGMIIVAYMAGYDPGAREYFDKLYNFYKAHISYAGGSTLMAWNQVAGCRNAPKSKTGDGNHSSTDADMDIAYSLLLAHHQWGSHGTIDYLNEARRLIRDIMRYEVNHDTWTPNLGNWSLPSDPVFFDTRTSDFIVGHFRAFEQVMDDKKWSLVIDRVYYLVERMQKKFSPQTGLLPDFIQNTHLMPAPASQHFLESAYDGNYYQNACRTPWRLATDYLMHGDIRAKEALDSINSWIMLSTDGEPERIKAGYYLNGESLPGSDYTSAAFAAPLAVSAMVDASNQLWLDHLWAFLLRENGFNVGPNLYYENTLKMLALIILSGNWWAPEF